MTTIQRISEDDLEPTLVTSLNNIVKNEGFVDHKKYVRAICTNGGNYMGDLFEVDIKGNSTEEDKELNLFIKQIKNDNTSDFVSLDVFQDREIFVYGELSTVYTQLMNDANIPESERYQQARCYDATDKFIIFENLAVRDFETLERTAPLTLSFAESAIKQLAKFHALSFVLKSKQTDFFNEKLKILKTPVTFTSDYFKLLKDYRDITCDLLDENSEKRLRAAYEEIINLEKYYGQSSSPKCLCHGDFRSNNMLIKQKNGTITDLFLIDFQLIYYSNPMNDFWYLLIPHSDREFRRKHLTTLKELYYDTLTQFLKYFDIDVSSVYPRKEFEVDYKAQTSFGLLSAFTLLSYLFAEEGGLPDMSDTTSLRSQVKLQDSAKERIQGIVDDYIEWGII